MYGDHKRQEIAVFTKSVLADRPSENEMTNECKERNDE
jgi:hypothetical protein